MEEFLKNFKPGFSKLENLLSKKEYNELKNDGLKKSYLVEKLGIPKIGRQTKNFWIARGYSEEESVVISKKYRKKRDPASSPMNIQYWEKKGFSKLEATKKIKSQRKSNVEYWEARGKTLEEAELCVSEFQKNNSKKLQEKRKESPELFNDILDTQIGYWLKKGYSEEEARDKVRSRQSTFSKEICISKFGEEEGLRVWQARQDKWQDTLNSKSKEEIENINKKKNCFGRREGESFNDYLSRLRENHFHKIPTTKEELSKYMIEKYETHYYFRKMKIEYFIKSFTKTIFEIFSDAEINSVIETSGLFFPEENLIFKQKFGTWNLKTKEGFLRSSMEIQFYDLLKEFEIEFLYEIPYETKRNSKLCDFYLVDYDIFIEIAGNMNDDDYRRNMEYKSEMFGAIILEEPKEYRIFLENLKKGNFDGSIIKANK